jgi:hypothetical protein
MQMMPKISWPQRVASDANGRAEMLVAAVIAGLLPFFTGRQFLSWHRFSRFAQAMATKTPLPAIISRGPNLSIR